jgi:NADPH-dependent ferric siderophore reductase
MSAIPTDAETPPPRQPGRLGRALIRLLMKHARVVEVEKLGDDFRLITLESPEFRGVSWAPGHKMQIAMGSAFVARTFTPIDWDVAKGKTRILGYAHGSGPGSAWIRVAAVGGECDVFGPRASLDVGHAAGTRVVLGDETSIGLAYAVSQHFPGSTLRCLFEVSSASAACEALERLKLDDADVFQRTDDDTHLEDIEDRLPALAASAGTFLLTGKAPSIQRLRRALKALGVPASRVATKAYWAPGRSGLD